MFLPPFDEYTDATNNKEYEQGIADIDKNRLHQEVQHNTKAPECHVCQIPAVCLRRRSVEDEVIDEQQCIQRREYGSNEIQKRFDGIHWQQEGDEQTDERKEYGKHLSVTQRPDIHETIARRIYIQVGGGYGRKKYNEKRSQPKP
jgi:hypothetical protein